MRPAASTLARKAASLLMSGRGRPAGMATPMSESARPRSRGLDVALKRQALERVLGQQHEVEGFAFTDAAGSVHAANGDQLQQARPGGNQIGQQGRVVAMEEMQRRVGMAGDCGKPAHHASSSSG